MATLRAALGRTGVKRGAAALIVALLICLPLPHMFKMPATAMEEGSIVEYATLTLHGEVPTKDYWTEYGPLNVYAPTVVFAAVHPSIAVERTLGLTYRLVLVGSLFWLLRRYSKRGAWIGAGLAWFTIAPFGLMAYSWIGGLGFCLLGLAALTASLERERANNALVVLSGLSYAVALGFRPDLIIVAVVPAAVLVWKRREVLKTLLITTAIGLLPYLYFLFTAGPSNIWRNLVIDPLFHLRDGRALPVPPSFTWVGEFFTRITALTSLHRLVGGPLPSQVALFFWLLLIALGVIVATVLGKSRSHDRRWIALVVLAGLLVTNFLQRADFSHFRQVGNVWIAMFPIAVAFLLERRGASRPRVVATSAALFIVIAALSASTLWGQAYLDLLHPTTKAPGQVQPSVHINGRTIPLDDKGRAKFMYQAAETVGLLAPHGNTLFEGPADLRFTNYNEPIFYWLEPKLKPSTYYLEMNPGISNTPESGLATQVDHADWVILSEVYERFSEPNTSTVPGDPAPNSVIDHHFCAVTATPYYEVLQHLPAGVTVNPATMAASDTVTVSLKHRPIARCSAVPSRASTTERLLGILAARQELPSPKVP